MNRPSRQEDLLQKIEALELRLAEEREGEETLFENLRSYLLSLSE